jgi:hypothetical protein
MGCNHEATTTSEVGRDCSSPQLSLDYSGATCCEHRVGLLCNPFAPLVATDASRSSICCEHKIARCSSSAVTSPAVLLSGRVPLASPRNSTEKPIWTACRAVVSHHMWVMYPEIATVSMPCLRSQGSNSVPVKLPGRFFSSHRLRGRSLTSGCRSHSLCHAGRNPPWGLERCVEPPRRAPPWHLPYP